jgi:hypothetical protein
LWEAARLSVAAVIGTGSADGEPRQEVKTRIVCGSPKSPRRENNLPWAFSVDQNLPITKRLIVAAASDAPS